MKPLEVKVPLPTVPCSVGGCKDPAANYTLTKVPAAFCDGHTPRTDRDKVMETVLQMIAHSFPDCEQMECKTIGTFRAPHEHCIVCFAQWVRRAAKGALA